MSSRRCRAVKGGFHAGQTAKARLGPPCAVTPLRDMTASILPALTIAMENLAVRIGESTEWSAGKSLSHDTPP